MQDSQFLHVLFSICLDALSHKVLSDNVLDLVGVLFLVGNPANKLIVVYGILLA